MVESTCLRGGLWDYKHIPNGLRALNWLAILVPANAGGGVASSRAAQGYPVMELHCRTWGVGSNRGPRSIVNLCERKWVSVIHLFQKAAMLSPHSHLYCSSFHWRNSAHCPLRLKYSCRYSSVLHPHKCHYSNMGWGHTHSVLGNEWEWKVYWRLSNAAGSNKSEQQETICYKNGMLQIAN